MNKNAQDLRSDSGVVLGIWDRFWFSGTSVASIGTIRGCLVAITVLYFLSAWPDAKFWYGEGGPLSASNVTEFLTTGGLEEAGNWIISPLFLTEAGWVYQLYLVFAIMTAVLVFCGRGGRAASFLLWLLFVGWANRAMLISGLPETLLSLGLFSIAIAPAGKAWAAMTEKPESGTESQSCVKRQHWTAGFSERLLATQITIIGFATWMAMLGGRVWFNGLGAYALAAPVRDRMFDWTGNDSLLVQPMFYESLTHLMVFALPLGFLLSWLPKQSFVGKAILVGWCVVVGLLGSHWLYAMTFAGMTLSIRPLSGRVKAVT